MKPSRIALAMESGALILPDSGRIAVFNPAADEILSVLPKERVDIIQGFRPDYDAFAAQAYHTITAANGPYAASLIFLPRAKKLAQALVAEAVSKTPDGLILLDGQKTDGIDSLYKSCRKRAPVSEAFSKAHGKLFWFAAKPVFDDWTAKGPTTLPEGFVTVAGLFSADGIDPASRLLAENLPPRLPARILDLGAGWGYLSRAVLERDGVEELHLIEADHAALGCACHNIKDARAHFHWADARSFQPEGLFDMVISNPPFHVARKADPDLGADFIKAAARMLKPSGQFWLVSNRHLPYEETLRALFANVEEKPGDNRFKLFHASRPKSGSRKRR